MKLKENLVDTLEVTVLTQFSSNLVKMFVSMISRSGSNTGHVKSKTRSWGKIKGKHFGHSIGHSFDLILIKPGQNVCLNEI